MSSDRSTADNPVRRAPAGRRARLANARRLLAAEDRLMLGQLAVERGYLREEELDGYLAAQRRPDDDTPRQPIGALLLRDGILTSSQVVELLREQRRRNLLCLFQDWTEGAPEEVLKLLTDPSRHLDGFILVTELGKGGMGVVWKAWDTKLRRWVAVKVLHGESGPELARFMREAFAAGRLRHPAIVPIHRIAECEGRPYLVMDLIDGGSLENATMKPEEAAATIVAVARAIAYAHKRGVVHRDVKPANLLRDRAGHIYVTDFGLAKFGDTASREHKSPVGLKTVSGASMGTPHYMPPEQALARPLEIDARSDVYGLGATLYKLATGKTPFAGLSPAEIILKVIRDTPVSPREVNPDVPRPLDAIIMKCLEKERDRRYPNADALADDLERFLKGEPVEARQASVFMRAVARVKRFKLRLAGAVALALVSFVTAAAVTGAVKDSEKSDSRENADRRFKALQKYGEAVTLFGRYEYNHGRVEHNDRTRQLAADALARIDEAIALDGSFGPLHVTKGRFLRLLGRYPEAMIAVEEGLKLAPEFHGGYLERGWLRLDDYRRQRPLPTVMITSHGSRRLPASAEPPAMAALLARAMEDLNTGVKLADQAGDGKPRSEGELLLARAHAALYAGRPDEARELLVDLRRRGSNPEDAAETLGHAHYQSGSFSRAIESFTEAIALRPRLARLYVARAGARWAVIEMAADRGDDPRLEADAAIEDLDEAARIDGDEPHALVLRALVRHAQLTAATRGGRPVRADDIRAVIALYDRAIDMRPGFAAALSGRALARGMLADRELEAGADPEPAYKAALEDAAAAVKSEPECVPALINRGGLHEAVAEVRMLRGGDPCDALRSAADDYAAALKLAPGDPVALLGQATARADLAVHSKVTAADAAEQLRMAVRDLDRLIEMSKTADALVARGNARRVLAQRFMPSGPSAVAEARLAVADYEEALALRPREWRVVASLALARVALVSNLAPDSEERPEQLRRAVKELSAFGDLAVLKPIRGVVTRAMAQ